MDIPELIIKEKKDNSENIKEIPKVYDPKLVEDRWYSFWMDKNYFHADTKSDKKSYCIVIPPPNITGVLHVGHALNNTLQDILARWKRMQGYNVLWMPGTDHAGIATQNVVERQLKEEKINRHQLGREKFIERVWKWREKSGGTIISQLKRLGASCDWQRERFTMDEGLSKAVKEVFVRLYNDGLIYRGNYIINWCPRCHTALSDIEVEYQETKGKLYHIKYPIKKVTSDKSQVTRNVGAIHESPFLIVATTRPETMLGDTAVAVNPNDERYKHLVGKTVILPLVNREIPIVADNYVDMAFGTGVVKITPAHDVNDFEVAKRHDLPILRIMDEKGHINENSPLYQGMDRFECRKKIIEDLTAQDLMFEIKDYENAVGHCYRCQTVVEPYLSLQWFVKMKPLAEPAIKAVEDGKVKFVPESWNSTYSSWMNNIRDWCISRQIWWGHRIPVWYCTKCEKKEGSKSQVTSHKLESETQRNEGVIVSITEPKKCPVCGSTDLHQDPDVLDTWFSSALWPFSTLGWPEKTEELKAFYPTSCLVTSFDILFFWVARMIMMGLKFNKKVPFKDVYIHALVRDAQGHKMSKSRGNVIDPLIMIDKFGTDALRFTLAAFAAQGRDIVLSEERIAGYRNFANKIWNASRFVIMNLSGFNSLKIVPWELDFDLADFWIRSRLQHTIAKVTDALSEYKFNEAAQTIYEFIWHEYCDWYLELAKDRLLNGDEKQKLTVQYVLVSTLEVSMRLLHPFMPFISEEIWQNLPYFLERKESIMISEWPELEKEVIYPEKENEMNLLMDIVTALRNIRSEMNIEPGKDINAVIKPKSKKESDILKQTESYIKRLTKTKDISIDLNAEKPENSVSALVGKIEIFVPLAGLIDLDKENARLRREMGNIENEIKRLSAQLENKNFVERAPKDIVQKEKDKIVLMKEKLDKLNRHLKAIQ
ncbi:MAG: valine--tRNA ligase [bacterium]|nr:valine--tRNA ligase [bacterium]